MFTEAELAQLPFDREAALLKAHEIAQSKTFTNTNELWQTDHDGDQYFDVSTASAYLSMVSVISSELGYKRLSQMCDISLRSESNPSAVFLDAFDLIRKELLRTVVSRGLAKRAEQKSIGFSPDTRSSLHTYISTMRNEIHKIELPINKKELILRRLNDLAKEIDTDRTRLQSLSDLALDLSDTADEVHRKLSPIRKLLERLFRKFNEAREEQEALAGPDRQKQIEGPKNEPDADESPF